MTGTGPFGAVGMGGMFSVVKVRGPEARRLQRSGLVQAPCRDRRLRIHRQLAEALRADASPGRGIDEADGRPKEDRRGSHYSQAGRRAQRPLTSAIPNQQIPASTGIPMAKDQASVNCEKAIRLRRAGGPGPRRRSAPKKAGPVRKEQKDWGIAGDAKSVKRTIQVGMSDAMRFTPDAIRCAGRDREVRLPENEGQAGCTSSCSARRRSSKSTRRSC